MTNCLVVIRGYWPRRASSAAARAGGQRRTVNGSLLPCTTSTPSPTDRTTVGRDARATDGNPPAHDEDGRRAILDVDSPTRAAHRGDGLRSNNPKALGASRPIDIDEHRPVAQRNSIRAPVTIAIHDVEIARRLPL